MESSEWTYHVYVIINGCNPWRFVLPEFVYQLDCNDKENHSLKQFPDIFFYFGDIRWTDSIHHRINIKVTQMSASSKYHRIYKINFKGVNIIFENKPG